MDPYIFCTKNQLEKKPIVPVLLYQPRSRIQDRFRHLTSQNKEQETDQSAVPEIEHIPRPAPQTHLANPVEQRVQEHIQSAGPGGEESPPVPVVVFRAEQEVDHQDRDRSASDDHEPVANKQEAEHIIHFAEPDARHDEIELDEDGAER